MYTENRIVVLESTITSRLRLYSKHRKENIELALLTSRMSATQEYAKGNKTSGVKKHTIDIVEMKIFIFFLYSSGSASVTIYLAHYWVVVFYPRAAATSSLDSVPLYVKWLLSPLAIIIMVPLSPPPRFHLGHPPPLPAHSLSLLLWPPLRLRLVFSFLATISNGHQPPSACLPSRLNAGWCLAAPGCLTSVPLLESLPRPTCAADTTWEWVWVGGVSW